MKKIELIIGAVFVVVGVIFLAAALFTKNTLNSLMIGFSFALICAGAVSVCKYLYWNSPKNIQRYKEKINNEEIELNDELKIKLRDRAGRYSYVTGIIIISFSIMLFSVLGKLEIISDSRIIVLYLGGYLVFQIVAGIAIFNRLLKKYN